MRLIVLGLAALLVVACASNDGGGGTPALCVMDANEPNETVLTATSLGSIHDDDVVGTTPEESPMKVDKLFSTHATADVDWFVVNVDDTGIGGNPALRVIISAGFEATAFWSCSGGTTKAVVCGLGATATNDPDIGGAKGCKTDPAMSGSPNITMSIECDGTSTDSGRLHIRVKALGPSDTCQKYRLGVFAE